MFAIANVALVMGPKSARDRSGILSAEETWYQYYFSHYGIEVNSLIEPGLISHRVMRVAGQQIMRWQFFIRHTRPRK
jgi:hypothetical protein